MFAFSRPHAKEKHVHSGNGIADTAGEEMAAREAKEDLKDGGSCGSSHTQANALTLCSHMNSLLTLNGKHGARL